jgi:hypothetical protein
MSDEEAYVSDAERGVAFAEDSPTLNIPIYPAGDNAGLHLQNDPNDQWQREAIIQRKGRVDIRCEHVGIAHGYHSDDCDDLYSLIILQFRFDPNGIAARIKEAFTTIKFAAETPADRDPVVKKIYPDGLFHVEPTSQQEEVVTGHALHIGLSGGAPIGLEVGGELKREKSVQRTVRDSTLVRGSRDVLDRNYPPYNGVSWSFCENHTAKTGVVCSMRGAILLKRHSMKPFKSSITLNVTADTHTRVSSLFEKDPKVDDIWYNPEKSPTQSLTQYVNHLGTVDMGQFCEVTMRCLLQEGTKSV